MLHVEPDDSRTADALAEAVKLAVRTGRLSNLIRRLAYLDSYGYDAGPESRLHEHPTMAHLKPDGAPASFGVIVTRAHADYEKGEVVNRFWFCGALIFHGPHDNGGDGGAPTFAVSVNPCDGWSFHT